MYHERRQRLWLYGSRVNSIGEANGAAAPVMFFDKRWVVSHQRVHDSSVFYIFTHGPNAQASNANVR